MNSRHVKLPLRNGIIMGISWGIVSWLSHGFTAHILQQSAIGFVLGALIGFVFVFIHEHYVKKVTSNASEENFAVHQQHTILLRVPYERAFELCEESLSGTKNIKFMKRDRANGKIKAGTGGSMNSSGNDLSFDIEKIGEQLTQVKVSSRPALSGAIVDNAANLKNVEAISKFLTAKDNSLDSETIRSGLDIFPEPKLRKAGKVASSSDAK